MDNAPFTVTLYTGQKYPSGKPRPDRWMVKFDEKFLPGKVRIFRETEGEAYEAGDELAKKIKEKGTSSFKASAGMSVKTAIRRFWALHGAKLTGKAHRGHMERNLELFEKKYGASGINGIGPLELHAFWNRPEWPEGKSTRWQAFTYLRIFFNVLEEAELIDRNPTRRLKNLAPTKPKPLSFIMTPERMKIALTMSKNYQRAAVSLEGLAGLRPSEALRVDPKRDFNWKAKEIRVVNSDKDGNAIPEEVLRYVKMLPAFIRHCPKTFKFPNQRNFYSSMRTEAKRLGIGPLEQDVFRHSWFTYYLAKSKNAAETAHEGGNSEQMVKDVYAKSAKEVDWKAYWAL